MRLHNLFESDTPESLTEDYLDIEITEDFAIESRVLEFTEDGGAIIELDEQAQELVDLDEETLNEFIPLAIGAAALGMTAYDAYRSYKQYKAGEITKGDLAKRVGMDAAIGITTGGIGKLASKAYKGAKAGIKSFKTNRAAAKIDTPTTPVAKTTPPPVAKTTKPKGKGKGKGKIARKLDNLVPNSYGSRSSYDNPLQRAVKNFSFEDVNEAEYQGRKVKLNKPMQGDVKKSKVYVKNPKGNVVKVNFGHGGSSAKGKTMSIKKNNPARRKSFRARHNCSNPGPKHKARYWSCKAW